MSPQEERAWLDWKLDKGIMTQKELHLYFNPDMTDEELDRKMSEVNDEVRKTAEAIKPVSPFQRILNA